MKKLLGVNVDQIALLRQAHEKSYPSVLEAAKIIESAGADSVSAHLCETGRHVQREDILALRDHLKIPLNLEIAPTEEMLAFALEVKPTYCTLVSEHKKRGALRESALDVVKHRVHLDSVVHQLSQAKILVALSVEPDFKQIEAAKAVRAPLIELHSGAYASAKTPEAMDVQLQRLHAAAKFAAEQGLQVNIGHGLHYQNVHAVVAIPEIHELNIGHSIISRALFVGLEQAVKEMLAIIRTP